MSSLSPPKYVEIVLRTLENSGYTAYLVGGCVRDMLMARHPNDWDICSSALPYEVMSAFPNTRPTGLKHGTVTVIVNGSSVEVTTFRSDGEYKDHRRPENVRYIADIFGDLERRDFTVNAIAMSLSGEILDPFGGLEDIQKKLIRCVGDPDTRFNEDALRMLRALRFSAVLGFEIDPSTLSSIQRNAFLSNSLAKERVLSELEKILLSPSPQVLSDIIECGLLGNLINSQNPVPNLKSIQSLPISRVLRWAGFCALLMKSGIITDVEKFLLALRLDTATIRSCADGIRLIKNKTPSEKLDWKILLSQNGIDTARCAAASSDVLFGKGKLKLLDSIVESGECFSRSELSVSGNDLMELGFHGTEIGYALDALLSHVLEFPEDNKKDLLINMAAELNMPK